MVDASIEVEAKQGTEFADKHGSKLRRADLLVLASIVLFGLGALVSLTGRRQELAADTPEPPHHFCW